VDACTVTALDAITAFAVPNPNCSSQSQSVFSGLVSDQVTLASRSPSLLRTGKVLFKPTLSAVDVCQLKQLLHRCQCFVASVIQISVDVNVENGSESRGEYTCHSSRLYSLHWTCRKLARSLDFSYRIFLVKTTWKPTAWLIPQSERVAPWTPRWNIAPTQQIATVRQYRSEPKRIFGLMRWGLIPYWAKGPSIGLKPINAMAETATEKPAFRDAMTWRRCLRTLSTSGSNLAPKRSSRTTLGWPTIRCSHSPACGTAG
jgi:hypothetical protein